MSKAYNPEEIELKWQSRWADAHCFEAEASHEKPKYYALIEFPYPSGAGLHVGHPRSNTAMDIIAYSILGMGREKGNRLNAVSVK